MTPETDSLAGTAALVTGATGFIGSHLCRRLDALGAEVHAVSRRRDVSAPGVRKWWRGDLSDPETARRVVAGAAPDVLFHLASRVSGARDLDLVLETFRDNLATTVNLLAAATGGGCRRIVLAGSLEEPEPERPHPVPSSPYAAAKWAAGGYARFFHALYGTPAVIARIFMVYGPDQKDEKKLVPYVTRSLLAGEAPEISAGTRRVDWIYVEDVVEGLLALAAAPGIDGETIDLGSGELVTVREVVETLCAIVAPGTAPRFGAVPDRPMEQVRVAATAKTQEQIGWRPRVSLREGLERTVDWHRRRAAAESG